MCSDQLWASSCYGQCASGFSCKNNSHSTKRELLPRGNFNYGRDPGWKVPGRDLEDGQSDPCDRKCVRNLG